MSVDREQIRKAFTLAHRKSQHPDTPARERNEFRAIARLIWQACGEEKPIPAPRPAEFSESVVITKYEDGTRIQTPLSVWRDANAEDFETAAMLTRLIAGEHITAGGGAAPLAEVWIEEAPSV